jgi:GT2 family glycosyltransferase
LVPVTTVPPRVTAVVVSFNARPYLEKTLEALRASRGVDLQVVVVDNASSDGSAEMVRERFPDAELIASDVNLGLAGGSNAGIARARGDYVCPMNEDLYFEPDTLRLMAEHLAAHPEAGAVGPHLLNVDGTLQPSGRALPSPGRAVRDRYGLWRLTGRDRFRETGRDYDRWQMVGEVPACCIMVPRSTLERVGPYDERTFFVYYEDADWCHRIRDAGLQVHYLGHARAVHVWGASTAGNPEATNLMARRGMLRYFAKHHGFVTAGLVRLAILPGDLAAVVRWAIAAVFDPSRRPRLRRAAAVLRATWDTRALRPAP